MELIEDIKDLDFGIAIDDQKVAISLCEEDLVFKSGNEEDMKKVIDVLCVWLHKFGKSKRVKDYIFQKSFCEKISFRIECKR